MYACMHACMYVCMHALMHACMYVCMYRGSNPAFSRGRQLVSFRFENRLPVPEHRNYQQQRCIYVWQWGRVGLMLADHRDGLLSSIL